VGSEQRAVGSGKGSKRVILKVHNIVGLLLVAAIPLLAEETSPLTLSQVIAESRANNAQLQSMKQKTRAMGERSQQAGALANPMLTYRGMDSASGGKWPNTDEKRVEIEQTFPWPGKRGLTQVMAGKDAAATQFESDAAILDVEMLAAETFYGLSAAQQSLAIIRAEESLLRRIEALTTLRYTTGAAGQQDVLKAQTEITMLKQKGIELEARELSLKNKLNTLMNRPVKTVIGRVEGPPVKSVLSDEGDQISIKALVHRPELQLAQARIERARAESAYMEKEGMPDYKVGLEYRSMSGDDQAMFMVGVELPIWRSKIRAGVRGASRMVESEQAAREAAERQVMQEAQDALTQIQAAQRTLELTRNELIPQAELRFSASEAGYRSGGKADFMDLLESERFLLNARVMSVMAEAELGMQWARLARAVGVSVLELVN
jgi:cobalt-zinc-cadmium efflux system outer membrane protein